jgi:hypothetical protein
MLRIRHSGNIRVKERASSMIFPIYLWVRSARRAHAEQADQWKPKIRHHGSGLAAAAE